MRKRAALGTRSCYTTGCGHPECRAANTAYFKARRAAQKAMTPAGVSDASAGERRGVNNPVSEVPAEAAASEIKWPSRARTRTAVGVGEHR